MTPDQMDDLLYDEDPGRAEAILRPLAEAGDPAAQFYMGQLCDPLRREDAVAWYRKSSDGGYHDGTHYLASSLYFGFGIEQNIDEALRLFTLSAEAGNDGSQWKLGQHYLGEDRLEEAAKWLRLSAKQGHEPARDLLEVATMHEERKREAPKSLQDLVGLRISIQRQAADKFILYFGTVRSPPSGSRTVGDFVLHVSCAWRLDFKSRTMAGSDDRWEYAGPVERPADWDCDNGWSRLDADLTAAFGGWQGKMIGRVLDDDHDDFVVISAQQGPRGNVKLKFSNRYSLSLFPASSGREAWRLFAPDVEQHLVFPPPEQTY